MADKILMKGNEAIAEAAIKAGCMHYFGYPITPQTEVAAYMAKRMPKIGGCFFNFFLLTDITRRATVEHIPHPRQWGQSVTKTTLYATLKHHNKNVVNKL